MEDLRGVVTDVAEVTNGPGRELGNLATGGDGLFHPTLHTAQRDHSILRLRCRNPRLPEPVELVHGGGHGLSTGVVMVALGPYLKTCMSGLSPSKMVVKT